MVNEIETLAALNIETVDIDEHCIGDRWTIQDIDHLVKLISIISMGQNQHAAKIIQELEPATPAFTNNTLIPSAIRVFSIFGERKDEQDASRYRRDGLLFEYISWIAAQQIAGPRTYLMAPHLQSTTQGIDGLMIELDQQEPKIARVTIFEDKCSVNPRGMFRDNIMRVFMEHHMNNRGRGPELVSKAAALISASGIDQTAADKAAENVLNLLFRRYRAALAVTSKNDSLNKRRGLFKNYDNLKKIKTEQRLGASFIVEGDLREWFEILAQNVITHLETMQGEKG